MSDTPETDALIREGPFAGPSEWIRYWDKAIDSHRALERSRDGLAAALRDSPCPRLLLQQVPLRDACPPTNCEPCNCYRAALERT